MCEGGTQRKRVRRKTAACDVILTCSPTRDTAARTIPPSPSRAELVPVPGDVTIGIEEYHGLYETQKNSEIMPPPKPSPKRYLQVIHIGPIGGLGLP